MGDGLLDDYRQRLLDRYRRQVAHYGEHPVWLDERASHVPIKPGEWSAHQILFHTCLVDEQVYGPRLQRILREDHPELEDFDSEAWMEAHYDRAEPASSLLDRWGRARQRYASEAEAAPVEAWSRTGRQPYWGERTLQWWVERAVAHAEDHWRQFNGE